MIVVDDKVRITMGFSKGLRGLVLKIDGQYATVQTGTGVVTLALRALEKVS